MPERSILAWLAIGFVVGLSARLVMPGRDPGGCIVTILIGIAGSLIAGFVAETMHWATSGAWQNYAASVVGALIVLTIYRLARCFRAG